MADKNLDNLLSEYEQKRRKAEMDLYARKEGLYKKIPRLKEIEDEINKISINKAKLILSNNSCLQELDDKVLKLKEEKDKIIKQNKINKNFFIPFYDCKICNDTGYILNEDGKTIMCTCLKQKLLDNLYNKSNLTNIDKENFLNFDENIFSNNNDSEYGCSPRQNIQNIKDASWDFINNFDNPDTKNLLFIGNTGLGKSYMSNCIANELLKQGKTVLYQTAPVLLETIIDNKFNKYKTSDINDFYNDVLSVDLLIIDDLGTEYLNSMKLSELFTIINTRILNLNKITKTMISTNLSIEKIFSIYEERIGSRIAGYYDIYQFFGEDLRLKKNRN